MVSMQIIDLQLYDTMLLISEFLIFQLGERFRIFAYLCIFGFPLASIPAYYYEVQSLVIVGAVVVIVFAMHKPQGTLLSTCIIKCSDWCEAKWRDWCGPKRSRDGLVGERQYLLVGGTAGDATGNNAATDLEEGKTK